jgi:hypothetical protein
MGLSKLYSVKIIKKQKKLLLLDPNTNNISFSQSVYIQP